VEWLKVKALNSNSNTHPSAKKKRKTKTRNIPNTGRSEYRFAGADLNPLEEKEYKVTSKNDWV
jgi:hypothetical protein